MNSIADAINYLREAEAGAREILSNSESNKHAKAAGYLQASVEFARQNLERIANQQQTVPEARGEMIAVEVLVPASHIDVEGSAIPEIEYTERGPDRWVDVEVDHAEIKCGILPKGWDVNDIDLDQDALANLLIEREEVVA